MYALCITPELSLEHIYWGTQLHNEFDLRYLSQSSRMTPFVTSEENFPPQQLTSNLSTTQFQAETLDDLQETWRRSKISSFGRKFEESDYIKKKRLENLSWRAMAIKLFHQNSPKSLPNVSAIGSPVASSIQRVKSNPATPRVKSRPLEFPSPNTRTLTRQRSYTATSSLSTLLTGGPTSSPTRHVASINDFRKTFPSTPLDPSTAASILSNAPTNLREAAATSSLQPTARATFDRIRGKIGKGSLCVEFSDHGTGDFRSPSFVIVDTSDGASLHSLHSLLPSVP